MFSIACNWRHDDIFSAPTNENNERRCLSQRQTQLRDGMNLSMFIFLMNDNQTANVHNN